jgi:Uma2 family endonuclease
MQLMATATSLVTAVEFSAIPDPGHPQELVRGVIVEMSPPHFKHGKVCSRVASLLTNLVDSQQLGHVLANHSGIITENNPDTVRGADVCFVGYDKVPADAEPAYLTVPPDAVFEVLSPSDRWSEVHRKVAEYLLMGVPAVYVLDPDLERVQCYYPNSPEEILDSKSELRGIGALAAFSVGVAKFLHSLASQLSWCQRGVAPDRLPLFTKWLDAISIQSRGITVMSPPRSRIAYLI